MLIGTDAARDDQTLHATLLERFDAFFHQGIDHGMLKAGGNIGAHGWITVRAFGVFNQIVYGRLHTTE